jgi:hypothetical protein
MSKFLLNALYMLSDSRRGGCADCHLRWAATAWFCHRGKEILRHRGSCTRPEIGHWAIISLSAISTRRLCVRLRPNQFCARQGCCSLRCARKETVRARVPPTTLSLLTSCKSAEWEGNSIWCLSHWPKQKNWNIFVFQSSYVWIYSAMRKSILRRRNQNDKNSVKAYTPVLSALLSDISYQAKSTSFSCLSQKNILCSIKKIKICRWKSTLLQNLLQIPIIRPWCI